MIALCATTVAFRGAVEVGVNLEVSSLPTTTYARLAVSEGNLRTPRRTFLAIHPLQTPTTVDDRWIGLY